MTVTAAKHKVMAANGSAADKLKSAVHCTQQSKLVLAKFLTLFRLPYRFPLHHGLIPQTNSPTRRVLLTGASTQRFTLLCSSLML